MNYPLTKEFTKINETTGTIQNPSRFKTIEVSNSNKPSSGLLLDPLQKYTFQNATLYLRCIDGEGEARVVPFIVDSGGGSSSGGSTVDDSQIATDEQIDQLLDDVFG